MNDLGFFEYLQLVIFYVSWLYFPAAVVLAWIIARRARRQKIIAALALAALSVLAYARFVEPSILLTVDHDIRLKRCFAEAGAFRLAVVSDMHIGLFPNTTPVARIAARLKAIAPDAALIAGDFDYFLAPSRFAKTYAPLGAIGAPVYAVLGNHDVGMSGPDVGAPLTAALEADGVDMIDNKHAEITLNGAGIELVGLAELWQGREDLSLVAEPSPMPRIVLAHHPEAIYGLPAGDARPDLLVAGHTHGGQVWLPGLTCFLAKLACLVTRYGEKDVGRTEVFVTSGTGMVDLPLRFLAAPRIDVLHVAYDACDSAGQSPK
ncbi:MAG TPA: metallophosphoesterase [Parvularculaceae bacterium]|nr:metallophosphoesterase [Parvularculaceae bacterium]